MRTKGYKGAKQWGAIVYTNDPRWKEVILTVKAFVKVPISLCVPISLPSRYVYLYGVENQSITEVLGIRAGLDKPLALTPNEFNLEGKVTYTLEEIKKGRRFQIRFTSIPGPPQTYHGFLKLKTNYPERPLIIIWIRGRFVKMKKG